MFYMALANWLGCLAVGTDSIIVDKYCFGLIQCLPRIGMPNTI